MRRSTLIDVTISGDGSEPWGLKAHVWPRQAQLECSKHTNTRHQTKHRFTFKQILLEKSLCQQESQKHTEFKGLLCEEADRNKWKLTGLQRAASTRLGSPVCIKSVVLEKQKNIRGRTNKPAFI